MNTLNLPRTGMVTSAIRGVGARKLGSIFENLHLNAFITPSVFAVKSLINLSISIGKSMLFHRDTLEKIGGFEAFRDILAEDHLMGIAVRELGLEVRNCPDTIDNINESWRIRNFINRHLRWAKLRKHTNEFYYMVELLSNPIPIALVYGLIRFDFFGLNIFLLTVLSKITIDVIINKMILSDMKWYHFSLIPIKDMVIGSLWFIPHFTKKVKWRGNSFFIGKNTQLIQISKG
jgi:ceramide glucosyltransferase